MRRAAAYVAGGLLLLAGAWGIGPGRSAAAPPPSWPTYHGSTSRDGTYPERAVTGLRADWTSVPLDGAVYAEPVWQGAVVYVATEDDVVDALSRATGRVLWSRRVGEPVALSSLPCGDINPLGITGTPVIADGSLWVAAEVTGPAHRLFQLSLANGRIQHQWAVDPAGSVPSAEQQRGALTYRDGTVYVPLGGLYGDCGPYHGYVVGVGVMRRHANWVYRTPSARQAGIWAPPGPVLNRRGDLYVATGNGASFTTYDGGDSVIELSPTLKPLGHFAPTDWATLNEDDLDLGSTSPVLLPHHRLFEIGKSGVGYLVATNPLPGIGHALDARSLCGGAYGADAYAHGILFVPCDNALVAVTVRPPHRLQVVWSVDGLDAGPPVVGGGAVFSVNEGTGRLMVYGAARGRLIAQWPLPQVEHFDAPTLAPGQVLVPAGNRVVALSLEG